MREWADIYVPALDERLALETKALFFVPTALQRCSDRGLTVSHLSAISSAAAIEGPRAGRNVIGKVLRFQPVAYDSAVGFLNVANRALEGSAHASFTTRDIVACVFRLRDVTEVLGALNKKIDDVAIGADVPIEIAQAAAQRYRLQLNDALAIWRYALSCAENAGGTDPAIGYVLTERPQDFIKTDVRPDLHMAVKRLDDRDFVYGWENLKAASEAGHYWALDDGEAGTG